MKNSKIKNHITILGYVQIGFSILGLMGAVAILVALTFARGFVGDEDVPQTVLRFLSISLPLILGSLSVLGLVGGIGLLVFKPWARTLMLIIAAISLVNIPFGTAKGVYALWVLLQDDAIKVLSDETPVVTQQVAELA
jgi:hypothetical protein